jgi:hypothetical protein
MSRYSRFVLILALTVMTAACVSFDYSYRWSATPFADGYHVSFLYGDYPSNYSVPGWDERFSKQALSVVIADLKKRGLNVEEGIILGPPGHNEGGSSAIGFLVGSHDFCTIWSKKSNDEIIAQIKMNEGHPFVISAKGKIHIDEEKGSQSSQPTPSVGG